ncbi:hypothetical protein [Terriglobus roseus]|uniref:Uncharacterized protein n=1 Tax=Terriglobus roseus TaxID=392734 RepID=A0A1H4J3H2_9BACT|nr:hypothetical protein [Terriglobus roseus]SEB40516.1 hypothetical protein SAMN05443244_0314 [Terriglobus roseus]
MTLTIHEQGGLLDSEIQLRIDEATEKQATTLEQKLKDHRDEIDRRLTTTDQAVRNVAAQTSDLKADVAVLMASDSRQTELLESIASNGDKWHEDDIEFRAVLVQRVSKIEVEQTELATQMKLLRWASGTSNAVLKAACFVLNNDTVRAVLIFGLLLGIAHVMSPALFLLAKRLLELAR